MSDETTEGTAGIGMFVAAYVDERGADNAYKQLKEAKRVVISIMMTPPSFAAAPKEKCMSTKKGI